MRPTDELHDIFLAIEWRISQYFSRDWMTKFKIFSCDWGTNFVISPRKWLLHFAIASVTDWWILWFHVLTDWRNLHLFVLFLTEKFCKFFSPRVWLTDLILWYFMMANQQIWWVFFPHNWVTNFFTFPPSQIKEFHIFFPTTNWRILRFYPCDCWACFVICFPR